MILCLLLFAVRYTAMLEDGTVFEKKGVDAGEPMKFVTDEGDCICYSFIFELLRTCLAYNSMKLLHGDI